MPPLAPAPFARSLATLDPEAFVRFVAALEAARDGVRSVDREGAVLVVRGRERRRLLPVAARRGPFRAPAPVGTVAGPVDEVVAQVDSAAARALADRRDARHRSPADLRDVALYGLDRSVGTRLLADHLGEGPGDGASGRSAVAVVAVATLLVVAVVVVGAFGGVTPEAEPTASTPEAAAVPPAETDDTTPDGRSAYPPGLTASGVADPEALASAHHAAVVDRPYRWVVVAGRTNATWGRRVDVLAVGPERVLESVAGQASGASEGAFTTHAEEGYTYIGIVGSNGTQYSREIVRHRPGDDGNFAARAEGYVARYLASPTGTVDRVEVADTTVYRVRVDGAPPGLDGRVSNYTATAVVTGEGFVARLDVAYTRHGDGDVRAVAFRFAYAPYRDDARPRWHEAAQRVSNGTATAGGAPGGPEGDPPQAG